MTPLISASTAEYLLQLAQDEIEFGDRNPQASRAVKEIERYLESIDRPKSYTLRQESAGWRIGAWGGLLMPVPSGEVARGLGALEIAIAYPGEPVRLADFLVPGEAFKNEHGTARKLISAARKWIADEVDMGLADLLAGCVVTMDGLDRPVVTCAPLPVPVVTSYAAPS